jgi:hypothetical protein
MKKILTITTMSLLLSSSLIAQPNLEKNKESMKKLSQMAGEKSPYYRAQKEAFPKDYFLVNQNLPFLLGVALFHPHGDKLKLSKEQLNKLIEMKKAVPALAKIAKEIKGLELEVAKAMIEEHKEPKSQYELVDKISKLRTELTKKHLECIYGVQKVLSPEQFKTLMTLATQKPKTTQPVATDSTKAQEFFKAKCSACHITTRPTNHANLIAPPIMGVMRHIKMSHAEKAKAVAFMKDYVLNPSKDKSLCMPQKIKRFGVMPSQKGLVTPEELDIILPWIFDNFPPKGFKGMGHKMGMNK